jgi:DNA replication and repair protein RecF
MHLESLFLRNFRNYSAQKLNFHPHFNLILGKNGHGKTNLLEAIYYIGYLNSFRTSSRKELLLWEQAETLLEGVLETDGCRHDVRIQIGEDRRHVEVDGKKPQAYRDYYSLVSVLLFEPRDVYLLRETPSLRRRTLNRAIFLEDPTVLKLVRDYEEVVSQKNRILKEGDFSRTRQDLDIWNERLAKLGALLLLRRLQWVKKINGLLEVEYRKLSGNGEKIVLSYKSSIPTMEDIKGNLPSEEQLFKLLVQAIDSRREEEFKRREAVVGPHRDDWKIMLEGQSLGDFGSQGENRCGIIALKMAQVSLLEKERGTTPIFLLDDVASELDKSRVEALFTTLRTRKIQVFLTTAEPHVGSYFGGEGVSFVVEGGHIRMLEKRGS